MTQTISAHTNGRGIRITTSNGYAISIGFGPSHYCENYSMDYNADPKPTSTMEVAIMNERHFVCLPHDVAGYVPVSNLSYLLQAVEAENWVRVCDLCDQDASDHENKFPLKEEKNV